MSSRRDYPEVLKGLAERLTSEFSNSGVGAELAVSMARMAVDTIRREWGGVSIYVPKCYAYERQAIHREMYRKHRAGATSRALAAEYGVTVHAVNATLRRLREEQAHDGD